ncbi:MAG: ABC transporter permease [Oscillospiraceae bacterium]|nr:ABC transporter permease [Oscillospiraceae bacterium]
MKFRNLLKKELSELITPQAIFSMIFTMVLLIFMGQIMGSAMEEGFDTSEINICNMDNTEFTEKVLSQLEEKGSKPNMVTISGEDYAAELERLDLNSVIVIPEGFADSILVDKKPAELRYVSELGIGFSGTMSSVSASDSVSAILDTATDEILLQTYGMNEDEIARIKEPVQTVEFTTFSGKTANISAMSLSSVLMMQSMIAPFVIFFLLMMASQMIMTAISTEKIDKTLETLLSAPVPRITVLMAKLVAAVIVALLNALSMMIGFFFYMTGMMGNVTDMVQTETTAVAEATGALNIAEAMNALGLSLGVGEYLLFGLQLFVTVAIGLAISLILGALAEDAKSVQNLTMPIMIMVMIPFFITMFMNVNEMSMGIKAVMYIIPFTHSYLAINNLMAGNMLLFWGGFVYQIIFFAVCMFFAVRIFTTDKIFTMTGALSEMFKKQQQPKAKK